MTHFKLAKRGKWGNVLVNNENDNGADFNEYSVEKGIISEMDLRGGNSITRKAHAAAEMTCIGGLRNTAETVQRRGAVSSFGLLLCKEATGGIESLEGFRGKVPCPDRHHRRKPVKSSE